MFPPFEYPAIKKPSPNDVYQTVEIVKKMADIAMVAGCTAYCDNAMGAVLETIESNLRFASNTLYNSTFAGYDRGARVVPGQGVGLGGKCRNN